MQKSVVQRQLSRDERGQSVSVFVVVVVLAMIIVVGLVIDGGQQARAVSRAESVAAGAARAAGNASAADEVAGRAGVGSGPVPAAEAFLAAAPDVEGTVTFADGRVTVTTRSTRSTIFLSLVGIDRVTGTGAASADVVAVGGS